MPHRVHSNRYNIALGFLFCMFRGDNKDVPRAALIPQIVQKLKLSLVNQPLYDLLPFRLTVKTSTTRSLFLDPEFFYLGNYAIRVVLRELCQPGPDPLCSCSRKLIRLRAPSPTSALVLAKSC